MRVPVSKKIDSKRRVTLPKDALSALGIGPGDEVSFSVNRKKIIIIIVKKPKLS